MKYKIVESVNKKENINHPVDDEFTLSEELLNIKSEKINESVENEVIEEDYEYSDYDKKLLVNRAKSIAKAISDLYNSNQVEAQGELPSENEIAKALLDSPKKIDMYAKFLSKMKATKKAESLIEKLVKELMNFKKKLSMVKKPQPATESMNEAVEELSDEETKEIIDTLDKMIEAGETSCECCDEPTKFLVKSELLRRGLKFNVSGNDRGNRFSYHFEWWNPKTESMNENRSVYTMSQDQMGEWNDICKAFAKKVGAKLVFVNETSCGLEFPDGSMKHVYIDEMVDYLGGMNESCNKEKKSYTKEEIMNMSTDKQRDVYENCVDHDKYPSFASWKKVFSTATPKTKATRESFHNVKRRSLNEADVPIQLNSDEMFNSSDSFDLKKAVKGRVDDQREKERQEAEAKRVAELKEKYKDIFSIIDEDKPSADVIEDLFEKLVPESGKAEIVAGELARAVEKIRYRWWNDGDVCFIGYGIETCGNALCYIASFDGLDETVGNLLDKCSDKIKSAVDNAIVDSKTGFDVYSDSASNKAYEEFLNGLCDAVVSWMRENPDECIEESNDMLSDDYSDDSWIKDYEPRKEIEVSEWNFNNELTNYLSEYGDEIEYTFEDALEEVEESIDWGWGIDAVLENNYRDCLIYSVAIEDAQDFFINFNSWCDNKYNELVSEYGEYPGEEDEDYDEEEDEDEEE